MVPSPDSIGLGVIAEQTELGRVRSDIKRVLIEAVAQLNEGKPESNYQLCGLLCDVGIGGRVTFAHPVVVSGANADIYALGGPNFSAQFVAREEVKGGGISLMVEWGGKAGTKKYVILGRTKGDVPGATVSGQADIPTQRDNLILTPLACNHDDLLVMKGLVADMPIAKNVLEGLTNASQA